ncbi:MAG: sensor histidine kinase [Bacteroidia bacterium]
MKARWSLYLLHFLGWAVFVTLPAMVLPRPRVIPDDVATDTLLLFLSVSALPLVGLFYGHLHWALPKLYLRRNWVGYFAFLIGGTLAVMALAVLLLWAMPWVMDTMGVQTKLLSRGTAYRSIVVLLISFALFAYQRWRLAETAKVQAELAFLKAQVNPHFLFNTLNSIYYLTLQQSDRAPAAVERLSGIMRYVIDEGGQDWVPLEREVAYLTDYISLQRLRFADNVKIDLQVRGDLLGRRIAPLLFVSFVENAFKHGISMEQDSPIHIVLDVDNEQTRFSVKNRKLGQSTNGYGGGIGLENTRKRLEILYPDRHRLQVNETAAEYEITLTLSHP